jgi:cytochrome c biogenesis protein CcdA
MMDGRKISMLLAWAVSFIMIGSGIVVLAGWFLPKAAPDYLRVMLGIVFLLMGAYRFLMTRLQAKQAERVDE